jgi:hypothetical protein
MRSEQTQRFPEICLGPESRGDGEDSGWVARGEGENMAGGKYFSRFREPTGVLRYLISMNGRRRRLCDAPRHLPVVRWVEVDFTVPVRFGDRRTRSAWARRRPSAGQTRIQTKVTTGGHHTPAANVCLYQAGGPPKARSHSEAQHSIRHNPAWIERAKDKKEWKHNPSNMWIRRWWRVWTG